MSIKNPLTPAGIEPATFRFVAQHLNHCATLPRSPDFVCTVINIRRVNVLFIQFHNECLLYIFYLFIYLFTSIVLHGDIRLINMQKVMYTIKSVYK